ncbi:MAG TPA: hypothetical protein VJ161_03555, partial [Geobacteraceae bacterium]|nr:hypothetical protein [Geobacteraceae bacterium]
MNRILAAAILIMVMVTLLVIPVPASALHCSDNTDCEPGSTCKVIFDFWLFKWTECKRTPCNSDSDCTGGTLCLLGFCQAGCRGDSD